jgi:hypothetical protein
MSNSGLNEVSICHLAFRMFIERKINLRDNGKLLEDLQGCPSGRLPTELELAAISRRLRRVEPRYVIKPLVTCISNGVWYENRRIEFVVDDGKLRTTLSLRTEKKLVSESPTRWKIISGSVTDSYPEIPTREENKTYFKVLSFTHERSCMTMTTVFGGVIVLQ